MRKILLSLAVAGLAGAAGIAQAAPATASNHIRLPVAAGTHAAETVQYRPGYGYDRPYRASNHHDGYWHRREEWRRWHHRHGW